MSTQQQQPAQSRAGGKKSHACGPCRRLKRKCDLQIPCGTCKSGRNTKIDECLANPARPLNNIQELIAPNLKFGRVQKRSSSSSSSANNHSSPNPNSNVVSPNVNKKPRANSGSQKRDDQQHYINQGNFGQFDIKPEHPNQHQQLAQLPQPPINHAAKSSSSSSLSEPQQLPLQSTMPLQPSPTTNFKAPQFPPQQAQSVPPPPPPISQQSVSLQQFSTYHQPIPMSHQHVPYNPIAFSQPSPLSHQQPPQQPPQQIQQSSLSQSTHQQQQQQQPSSRSGLFFDENELLKKQLEAQFHRIQQLESENSQTKSQVQDLQNELNTRKPAAIPTPPSNDPKRKSSKNEYKTKYLNLLPSQIQTTVLVNFYLQNIDYIYHPLHHPSFLRECEEFWKDPENVDVGWLAVLFMVLSLAAIHLPKGLINISSQEIEKSHNIWFNASRECINIWDSMQSDPTQFNIYTLQCFSLCQLYFYATKRAEALNEILEKAIKDALNMGLDKVDKENPNLLEVQMKRRLWWDICGCDTFRALSLGVKPLIRSYNNRVPLPANSNDSDITKDSIVIRSNAVATDNSFNIYRATMMKILNGVYEKEHEIRETSQKLKTDLDKVEDQLFKGLVEIDIELCDSYKGWFFQMDEYGNLPSLSDPKIQFQHHMLHTCICIHRFRIYQNYLSDDIPIAWEVGVTSARALFEVYKRLRKIYDLKNPLFLSQIHQSFTGSIIQSMLLLLNHKISLQDQSALYQDIDWMLKDLEILGREVFILKPEVLKESFKVLNALKNSLNKNLVDLEKDQKDIVSNVFGGKDMTEHYLQKCTVSFIIDKVDRRSSNEPPVEEKNTFDSKNQLGTLVNAELIGKSVKKFEEIRKPQSDSNEDVMGKQLQLLKAQAIHQMQGGQDGAQSNSVDHTGDDSQHQQQRLHQQQLQQQFQQQLAAQQLQQQQQQQHHQHQHQQQIQSQTTTANLGTVQEQGYPLQQLAAQQSIENNNNGITSDGFVRQTTPMEINFTGIDSFWNDVGPQGIDELNNMYYSEFSGYRIA